MKRYLMHKMVKTAAREGSLLNAYPLIVKYCWLIGVGQNEIDLYIRERYNLEMEKI